MTHTEKFDTDVLVIGTGPMGATTALALATYGVKVTWGTGDAHISDCLQGNPCTMLDLPQNRMEPILAQNALTHGAGFSFNTESLGYEQDNDGVTVSLRDLLSGRDYSVRACYLVGDLPEGGVRCGYPKKHAGTMLDLARKVSRFIGIRPRAAWDRVRPFKTRSTWRGSWLMSSRVTPVLDCSSRTRRKERPSVLKSLLAPISRGSITLLSTGGFEMSSRLIRSARA